jgi:hypothetical protein
MNEVIRKAFESQVDPKYAAKIEADFFEMGYYAAIDACTEVCRKVKDINHVYTNGAILVEKSIHKMMGEGK